MRTISIRLKLPLAMVSLTATAIVAMGVSSFMNARATIVDDGTARLAAVADLRAQSVATFFETIARQIDVAAEDRQLGEAIGAFASAFAGLASPEATLQRSYIDQNPHPIGQKELLEDAGTGTAYDTVHALYHQQFNRLRIAYGYYDVFLMDAEGNVVYTVFKETDFATNLLNGPWRDSGLGQVYRAAMSAAAGDAPAFVDFAPYAPSADAPASFIARPIFGPNGDRLGVLAYQMPIDAINEAVRSKAGLGQTGDVFLVGADGLLRTDSLLTAANDILQRRIENPTVDAAFSGTSAQAVHRSADGVERLYAARPMSFLGTDWALVAHQDVRELNASLVSLAWVFLAEGGVLLTLTLILSIVLSRGVSRPLGQVGAAMEKVAAKKFETAVPATDRGDEIGGIARTLEEFRKSLLDAAGVAREAAFKSAGFEVSGAPMLMTDLDLRILQANSAMTRFVHDRAADFRSAGASVDADDLIGRDLDDFPFPDGPMRDRLSRHDALPIRQKMRFGEAYVGVLIEAVHDRSGTHVGYVVEWRDQTLQMQSQVLVGAIDASQVRLEMRLDGRIKTANRALLSLLGCEAERLVDRPAADLVSLDQPDGSAPIWDTAKAGQAVFGIFSLSHGGRSFRIDGSLNPVPDEQGRPGGFLLIGSDVTERQAELQRLEDRRRAMVEEQRTVVDALALALRRLSQGDLTARIATAFPDDYDQLRRDFNSAMDTLHAALGTVTANASLIRSEAVEISGAAENLSQRTVAQAATLEETAAAIAQLNEAVRSAAQGAGDAATLADEARRNAEKSGEVVETTVTAMSEIESSSKAISQIIKVIDGIAFQTNLLALNAGVEAARAGEAGRGFAVVASEVRALAQRSSEAALEIGGLITSATGQVKRGVELVGETGEALHRIITSMTDIAHHVGEIARSASEQSNGLAEINAAMGQLDRTTQQNAAMVEQTTSASRLLTQEAEALAEAMGRFRLDGTATARPAEVPLWKRPTAA